MLEIQSADKNVRRLRETEGQRLVQRLSRTMLRTVTGYGLIEEGDRILVALSGGKDSYTMLDLLTRANKRAPISFELIGFHLDKGQPEYDGAPLREWLEKLELPPDKVKVSERRRYERPAQPMAQQMMNAPLMDFANEELYFEDECEEAVEEEEIEYDED